MKEPLKNYTTNAGAFWQGKYKYRDIYMMKPVDISNEKGLMTLLVPENVVFAKCFTSYKK